MKVSLVLVIFSVLLVTVLSAPPKEKPPKHPHKEPQPPVFPCFTPDFDWNKYFEEWKLYFDSVNWCPKPGDIVFPTIEEYWEYFLSLFSCPGQD